MPRSLTGLRRCRNAPLLAATLALAVIASACGTGPQASAAIRGRIPSRIGHLPEGTRPISRAQLSQTGEETVYLALRRLRPDLFAPRRRSALARGNALPEVYVNGQLFGDIDVLRSYPTSVVSEVRFMSALDAAFRFGRDHPAGVILLTVIP